jgi:hypothetical protein
VKHLEKIMKASFVIEASAVIRNPALRQYLPRTTRKALRVTTPKAQVNHDCINTPCVDQIVTDWLAVHDPLNDQAYLATNTIDPASDFTGADEFGDIDNELDGLTIYDPMDEATLWRFCTGYDVL